VKSASKLVIIADSDHYVREIMGRFVTDAGYEVSFAVDGYEALDNARKSVPIAVIADMMLPRLDGLALCRILKADVELNKSVAVVICSVLAAEERALAAGANGFIGKPLEKNRLVRILKRAISEEAMHE
jgi:CheY-like chemotaxis protein